MARGGKREGSGRPANLLNKITRDMKQEALDKYPNFSPLTALIDFYHETEDEKLKLDSLKEICKKYVPDMKAVDVVTDGQPLTPPALIQLIGNPPTTHDQD